MQAHYLTPEQAAEYLGLSASYLAKLRMGTGPVSGPSYIKVGLRSVRYAQADLDAWMEQRLVGRRQFERAE